MDVGDMGTPEPSARRLTAERPLELVEVPETQGFERHLQSLQTAVAALTPPVPLRRIAAVAAQATIDALDAQAMVIAVYEADGRHLRGVYVAGVPEETRRRLSTSPTAAPSLIAEIHRYLSSAGSGTPNGALAASPISQGERTHGLLVVGRSHHRPFSADDRSFLSVLAGLCAIALDRLHMSSDLSRVRAVLRRRRLDVRIAGAQLRVGDMKIDLEEQTITIGSHSASLTPSEMRLLTFLAEEPGRARSRRAILRHLWHTEHVADERACDVHISNLRRKIEHDPSRPKRLVTLRGVGYALLAR